jgi:hypothetical protein
MFFFLIHYYLQLSFMHFTNNFYRVFQYLLLIDIKPAIHIFLYVYIKGDKRILGCVFQTKICGIIYMKYLHNINYQHIFNTIYIDKYIYILFVIK